MKNMSLGKRIRWLLAIVMASLSESLPGKEYELSIESNELPEIVWLPVDFNERTSVYSFSWAALEFIEVSCDGLIIKPEMVKYNFTYDEMRKIETEGKVIMFLIRLDGFYSSTSTSPTGSGEWYRRFDVPLSAREAIITYRARAINGTVSEVNKLRIVRF